jgi:hypothetical protein
LDHPCFAERVLHQRGPAGGKQRLHLSYLSPPMAAAAVNHASADASMPDHETAPVSSITQLLMI